MNVLDFIFPHKCPVCGEVLRREEKKICRSCRISLPCIKEPRCKRCGKPITAAEEEYCHDCEKKRKGQDVLEKGTALWVYDAGMKQAMASFKYEGCVADAVFFAEELFRIRGGEISQWNVDAIIPVPIHRRKRWFRGYNQAAVLAEELGELFHLPVFPDVLTRIRYTRPQKGLDSKQRTANAAGAFALNEKSREMLPSLRRVLLVDDIYTTGATLEACGEVMCKAGVQEVYFACLCIGTDY